MSQIDQNLVSKVQGINKKYVGWYMFVENNTLPGEGIRHAFPKAYTVSDCIDELIKIIKENQEFLHMERVEDKNGFGYNYFIYHTPGNTLVFKTLIQALCERSFDRRGKLIANDFMLDRANRLMVEKFKDADIRYPSGMFRMNNKGNSRGVPIHETEPAFVVHE